MRPGSGTTLRLVFVVAVLLATVLLNPVAAEARTRSSDGHACTIVGTPGRDVLKGTKKRDVICGRGGNDVIKGGGGNDVLDGGPGRDRLSGGAGRDRLLGGSGNDVLSGGASADRLDGGSGTDQLSGGDGGDVVLGAGGDDRLSGGAGKDRLSGGPGRDRLSGGAGTDVVGGDAGDDRLDGGSGADRLSGDGGNDLVLGASGDDDLSGGPDVDHLDGGAGFNLCDVPGAGDQQLRCATDEAAPVVVSVTTTPSVVDVSDAPRQIQVRAHVTDDTGVATVELGPMMGTLVSGSRRDGVWQATLRVAQFGNPGPRSLLIAPRDRVGRLTYQQREGVYSVVNRRVDREPPVLTSMSLSTTAVDVRASAQTVSATVTITDDLAGPGEVTLCPMYARVPWESFDASPGCAQMRRVAGGPQNGTWTGTATVPKGADGGTWNMQVNLSDAADNFSSSPWLGPEALAALENPTGWHAIPGGAGAFTVIGGAPDQQAPSLTSVVLSPSTVDTSRGAVRVTATISGTDDVGISMARMSISGRPTNAQAGDWTSIDIVSTSAFQLVSGTPMNGSWQTTFVVPGGTPNGAYGLEVGLYDRNHSPSWASPGTFWSATGRLDTTPAPSTTSFVVANSP